MNESFPYYYEDGYIVGGLVGWKQIYYGAIYRNTQTFPYQWNKAYKSHKPVALFMSSQWRGNKSNDNKKCWFSCNLFYRHSAN